EMIYKEERILFPMSLDTLTENDWYEIYEQSDESGYCLFYPEVKWSPINLKDHEDKISENLNRIKLSTGSFTKEELESFFKTLPVDITFVDKDDKVRFFSEGTDRIFGRSKAIIGRQVQFCHPPSSVHIVEKILNDFKSNKENSAKFWINIHGKFVHIAYYAMRSENSEYLGTLEVTQNIQEYKTLEGERRILQYE
ncbi:MAG: PAS domain-containing protein, partial [Ignavibacteriaceae bacterium]|nr:PAS domain-containing protein [Ignavibacteriaceae bacterium]